MRLTQPLSKLLFMASATLGLCTINLPAMAAPPAFAEYIRDGSSSIILGRDVDPASLNIQGNRIFAAGRSQSNASGTESKWSALRLNQHGALDISFDRDGKDSYHVKNTTINRDWSSSGGFMLPNGKIILTGAIETDSMFASTQELAVLKLNEDGSRDTSFGNNGELYLPLASTVKVKTVRMTPTPTGVILAVSHTSGSQVSVMHVTQNGALDPNFGNGSINGMGEYNIPITLEDMLITPSGHILLLGQDGTLAMLESDGSTLNSNFGNQGMTTPNTTFNKKMHGMALQTVSGQTKIVVVGEARKPQPSTATTEYTVMRLNQDGSLDNTFGNQTPTNGFGLYHKSGSPYHHFGHAIAVSASNELFISGTYTLTSVSRLAVFKLNEDGIIDASFGNNGLFDSFQINDLGSKQHQLLIQPDGKILGMAEDRNYYTIYRLLSNGTLDTSFGRMRFENYISSLPSINYNIGSAYTPTGVIHPYDSDNQNSNPGYLGTTLTIQRAGGANPNDEFLPIGNLSFQSGSALLYGSIPVGNVNLSTPGFISIQFGRYGQEVISEVASSLAYRNTSMGVGSVYLEWTFSDGTNARTVPMQVNFRPNSPPSLTGGTPLNPLFKYSSNSVILFNGYVAQDAENNQFKQLTVTVNNVQNNSEHLLHQALQFKLEDGQSGSISNHGIDYSVSVNNNIATVVFDWPNLATAAEISSFVNNLAYTSYRPDYNAVLTRDVTITALQDDGGGSNDTAALQIKSTVNILPRRKLYITINGYVPVSATGKKLGLLVKENNFNMGAYSLNTNLTTPTEIAAVLEGNTYTVNITEQPTDPWQTCTAGNTASGVMTSQGKTVNITCTTDTHTVRGNASGIQGSGLVLQNNGGDDLAVNSNGIFTFNQTVASGQPFNVSIKSTPNSPKQTCQIAGNTGTIQGVDVSSVEVICARVQHTVTINHNGNGSTMPASSIQVGDELTTSISLLPNAGHQALATGCNGTQSGNTYTTGQITSDCTIDVTFVPKKYHIGGTSSNILGSGLTLQNNNGDDLTVTDDNGFTFNQPITHGQPYAVSIKTMPTSPRQTCTLQNASGTVAAADVTDVHVQCQRIQHSVTITSTGTGSTVPANSVQVGDELTVDINLQPPQGQTASASGCDGTLSGLVYTTGEITSDCTVNVMFFISPLIFDDGFETSSGTP